MSIILPSELTPWEIDNITKFSKKYAVRIKLFRNESNEDYDSNPVGSGDYNASTGEYELENRGWLKKVSFTPTTGYDYVKIEYNDDSFGNLNSPVTGEWITCKTYKHGGATTHFLKYPVYSARFRISEYKESDPTNIVYPSNPKLGFDDYHDITDYCGGEISIDNNVDNLKGGFKLPFTSISLKNEDGRWGKNSSFMLPYFKQTRTTFEKQSASSVQVVKGRGTRCCIEIKFFGPNWEDSNWIIISNFYIRKFTSTSISGESAWVAKTRIKTTLFEGITPSEIVEKYIVMNEGDMLVQLDKRLPDEVISIPNESVGYLEMEPTNPLKIKNGVNISCHCQDGQYIYYAKKISSSGTDGGYAEIHRMTQSGEDDIVLGKIYVMVNNYIYIPGDGVLKAFQYTLSRSGADINNNTAHYAHIRDIYGMCVDSEFLYITLVSQYNAAYPDNASPFADHFCTVGESLIYKLNKNGLGWAPLCKIGANHDSQRTSNTAYTVTSGNNKRYSHGFMVLSNSGTYNPISCPDYYDVDNGSQYMYVYTSIQLYDDNGTEKLLVVKELKRKDTPYTSQNMCEFYLFTKLFSGTLYGNTGKYIRINSLLVFDKETIYCCYGKWSSGSISAIYLGIVSRNGSGNFYINEQSSVVITEWFHSMTFIDDAIYAGGCNYDGSGYTPTAESVSSDGIKQKYICRFNLDGFNIIHTSHQTRNNYIAYPYPEILVGGSSIQYNNIGYRKHSLDGDIYTTAGFVINLITGELLIRQLVPAGIQYDVTAQYDFIKSVMFFELDAKSRLGADAIDKISQLSMDNFYVNEYGALSRLNFLKWQSMGIRDTIFVHDRVNEDLDEYWDNVTTIDSINVTGIQMCNNENDGVNELSDKAIAIEFTPKFNGILDKIKLPIKISDESGTNALSGTFDVELDVDLYYCTSAVDFSCSDADDEDVATPPTSANIQLIASTKVYISYDRLITLGTNLKESQYYWISFDLSAGNKTVVADQKYAIIIRTHAHDNYLRYRILGKDVSPANNKTACIDLNDGANITGISSGAWTSGGVTGLLSGISHCVPYCIVEVKKTKAQLISKNIVDQLNPSYASQSFSSLHGGTNTTILVSSIDFLTSYTRGVDYNITYSSGKFYIEFIGGAQLADIDKNILISWYDSPSSFILEINDSKVTGIINEKSEYGDDTFISRVLINGKKPRPSSSSVKIEKVYDIVPGVNLPISSTNLTSRKGKFSGIENYIQSRNIFETVQNSSEDSFKFVFEFDDPFIVGTTGYKVKRGAGENGSKILAGSITVGSNEDVPLFYRVDCSAAGFNDTLYHVMIKPNQYSDWRLAISNDYADMIGNCVGTEPANASSVKTASQFYLKRMNSAFGNKTVNYIAYESVYDTYYINKDGVLVKDQTYSASDPNKNPVKTGSPDKTIIVELEPRDFGGNPLFPFHSENAYAGYDAGYDTDVKKWMSGTVIKCIIASKGINITYSNYDTIKKFLRLTVFGHPINNVGEITAERKMPGYEHSDAKEFTLDNEHIQIQFLCDLIANFIIKSWGVERVEYNNQHIYDPRLRPGAFVIVTSSRENLSNKLFFVTSVKTNLSVQGGFISDLPEFLQI